MRVSKAEYARHRGVSKPYVSKLVKEGVVPVHGQKGLIDVQEADRILDERAKASGKKPAQSRPAEGDYPNYAEEKARKERALRVKYEMENAVRKGELVEAVLVRQEWEKHIMVARNRLLAMGPKLAPVLVALETEREMQAAIASEVYDALNELARWGQERNQEATAEAAGDGH